MSRGWYGNRYEHSIASRGIRLRVRNNIFSRGISEQNTINYELMEKAVKHFGTTNNPYEAGYILPDGSMLDFSAGNENARYIDHSEIDEIGIIMHEFIDGGAIRFNFTHPKLGNEISLELSKITNSQKRTIGRIIKEYKPTVYVDIIYEYENYYFGFDTGVFPSMVFNKIDKRIGVVT